MNLRMRSEFFSDNRATRGFRLGIQRRLLWRLDERPFACERIHDQEFAVHRGRVPTTFSLARENVSAALTHTN